MNSAFFQKYLPYIAVAVTGLYFASNMRAPSSSAGFDFHNYGRLPVIDGGRLKPMDSVARSNLMIITHRQTYYDYDANEKGFMSVFGFTGKDYPATKWLLDVQTTPAKDEEMIALFQNGAADRPGWKHKVLRIENDQLIALLKLERRDGLRYSIFELIDGGNIDGFFREANRVDNMDPKQFTLFDAKVSELAQHIRLYLKVSSNTTPLVIPNPNGSDQWMSFRDAMERFGPPAENPQGVDEQAYVFYYNLLVSYDKGDVREFNSLLAKRIALLESQETLTKTQGTLTKINTEVFFNDFAPFYHCLVVYVFIVLAGGLTWLLTASGNAWAEPIRCAAYAAMFVTFLVHLAGLVSRMYLTDRYFVWVTNLYSSAVFIGWGAVAVCLIVEWIYRNGIGLVVGSIAGFLTLIIAHILSWDGDTLTMMQAVLDTNFWLSTHVTCVTLGYTMAFTSGLMGIAYIGLGIFTNTLRKEGSANLTRMTYGVVCGGMFLSFVGTVLGGLWADYSWGRFWGWDPKENGALLIVIWMALILHARWGCMVKHRGIAVLSVMGIVITSWSWFGTNFLGVGLHAYGGAKGGAMTALVCFDLFILAIAGLGAFLPLHHWQSFRAPSGVTPSEPRALATGLAR